MNLTAQCRWTESVSEAFAIPLAQDKPLIGVMDGEGIGCEVMAAALAVLQSVSDSSGRSFEVRRFSEPAIRTREKHVSSDFLRFCRLLFAERGSLLCGPVDGRFVYDLRRELRLFCKLVPIRACPELSGVSHMSPKWTENIDLLLVRENVSGLYQGEGKLRDSLVDGRVAEFWFHYGEEEIRAIVGVAARLAARRRGLLAVIVKDGGIPSVSRLWRTVAGEVVADIGIDTSFINVDLAGYKMIQHTSELDVVVAPNFCGDILADLGGVLVGSRGLTFSGNYSREGASVYQTNHGCALDLAGTGRANPAGQILSLAMMLHESFGMFNEAKAIEAALHRVWSEGWRTADILESGCRVAGTRDLGDLVAHAVKREWHHETYASID